MTIYSVPVNYDKNKEFIYPIQVQGAENDKIVETEALLDCGAGGKFIDQNYMRNMKWPQTKLEKPIRVRNVDGTLNKTGMITHQTELTITVKGKTRKHQFLITGLGKQKIILGLPWFTEENPDIDWKNQTVNWRPEPTTEEQKNTGNRYPLTINAVTAPETMESWINAKELVSQLLNEQTSKVEEKKTLEELVPPAYHEQLDIFDEEKANRLPQRRKWDHAIELKPDYEPKVHKLYSLSPKERDTMNTFIDENLAKGYIRESKSEQASPFFFRAKKDGKLRPILDYRVLNDHTIKNAYPLPRIEDLMAKLQGARYFTKMDLRWGFNNVRIKEGDEWKAAFITE